MAPSQDMRRDRVSARHRQLAALRMAIEGRSYDEIAEELGFAGRGAAWKAAQTALQRHEASDVKDLRLLENARLDGLLSAYWSAAIGGDVRAADLVLKVIAARSKLMGLDAPERQTADRSPQTIVVGSNDDYLSALRAMESVRASFSA